MAYHFYPRPPRGGRLPDCRWQAGRGRISIHALREEGDPNIISDASSKTNFYPRPPRGGRRAESESRSCSADISIHALREEGDFLIAAGKLGEDGFLSTPSARRATFRSGHGLIAVIISIHALREEGDAEQRGKGNAKDYFYPRPPRGGRLKMLTSKQKAS